jgi:hypothetical protein
LRRRLSGCRGGWKRFGRAGAGGAGRVPRPASRPTPPDVQAAL